MGLPRSVEEAERRANELIEQRLKATGNSGEGEPPKLVSNDQKAPEEPEEPEKSEDKGGSRSESEPEPESSPEKAKKDTSRKDKNAEPGDTDLQKEYEKLQQRHRVLQGKYSAEVPRMAAEIRKLKQQIQKLQEEAVNAKPKDPDQRQDSDGPDPEVFSEYGEEFKQLAEYARQVRKDNMELKAKIAELEQHLGSVAEQSRQVSQADFYQQLGSLCEDWEELNYNQDFIQWLQEPSPYTGVPRQESLNDAVNQGDAARTAAIFNEWKALVGMNVKRQPDNEPVKPKNQQPAKKRSADVSVGGDETYYTRAQIQKLYDDYRRGLYDGKEDEWKRIERDIFRAQREGRIHGG